MVSAALAITRYLTATTRISIKKIVQTLRTIRSATVEINGQRLTLNPEIPERTQAIRLFGLLVGSGTRGG